MHFPKPQVEQRLLVTLSTAELLDQRQTEQHHTPEDRHYSSGTDHCGLFVPSWSRHYTPSSLEPQSCVFTVSPALKCTEHQRKTGLEIALIVPTDTGLEKLPPRFTSRKVSVSLSQFHQYNSGTAAPSSGHLEIY